MKRTTEALIVGVCLMAAATIFGMFFYGSRSRRETISVVGAATGRFESDVVKWRIGISKPATAGTITQAYSLLNNELVVVESKLKAVGIDSSEITVQPVNTMPIYRPKGEMEYNLIQSIIVISRNIPTIARLALNPGKLVSKGLILQSSSLEYYFSRLAEIKQKLLSEATADAAKRAEAIADNAGVKIGDLMSAREGVFQITEPYSTEVSSYGVYNTATRKKDITVTVHCVFELK